jgi:hypothetical protein
MWIMWFIRRFPAPGEAVADDLAGRGLDGSAAGPRDVLVAVGEPGDVTGVGQGGRGDDRADAGQLHQVEPVARTISLSWRVSALISSRSRRAR